ncbi:MAG: chromate transporter [Saccharofermentans sp.]|nr:chromate transporter [Saccharofermentans sp.]
MLPMLKYELVEKNHWVTEDEILDYYAVGQCTPGIIAVNVATFVGFKRKGVLGGIFSTLGMVSPSLIIVSILAMFLNQFMSNEYVAHAVGGIKIVVCALMLNTVVTMAKKTVKSLPAGIACILAFVLAMFSPVPTVLIVVAAGVAGIILYKLGRFKA